jgi:hypothetical protein
MQIKKLERVIQSIHRCVFGMFITTSVPFYLSSSRRQVQRNGWGIIFGRCYLRKILTKEEIKGNHDAPMVASVVLVQLCP